MLEFNPILEPGMIAVNPDQASWGQDQIQSIINDLITVNFEHVGEQVIEGNHVLLEPLPNCGEN